METRPLTVNSGNSFRAFLVQNPFQSKRKKRAILNFRTFIRLLTVIYSLAIAFVVWCASASWYKPAFAWVKTYASDKWLHFVLVGTMALLLNLSLNLAAVSRWSSWLLWGTFTMLLLATLEELSQQWLSNRTFDLSDLACNYLGILIIGHLPWLFRRNTKAAEHRL